MKYDYLIFDLDGTISDPKQGIVNSLNHSLKLHGFSERSVDELCQYIGPPMDSIFSSLVSSKDTKLINSLISTYRERYSDIGFSENVLYAGITESLHKLSLIPDIKLGICTSKRVDFAEKILELFSIREFFYFVNGGDVGIDKWQQLSKLLDQKIINRRSLMIGDRYIDLTAAHKNGLESAGVLWGYGSLIELSEHKPVRIITYPNELISLVK